MAKLLFNLRNVPDDEADEVRDLLTAHGVDWYETRPGNWGISTGALGLRAAPAFPQPLFKNANLSVSGAPSQEFFFRYGCSFGSRPRACPESRSPASPAGR